MMKLYEIQRKNMVNRKKYISLIIPLLIQNVNLSEDLFSSTTGLKTLIKTRQQVIKDLETYNDNSEVCYLVIHRYLKRYAKENDRATLDINRYVANPLNSYILIKSLAIDLKFIEKETKTVIPRHKSLVYPHQKDLEGAVQSLKQLHLVYKLNVSRLADGELLGNQSTPLTSTDCYLVGRMLFLKEHSPELALAWLKVALRKYVPEDGIFGFNEKDLMKSISDVYFALGDKWKGSMWLQRRRAWQPGNTVIFEEEADNITKITKEMEKSAAAAGQLPEGYSGYKANYDRYHSLCRGEHKVDHNFSRRLKCMYLTDSHPFLRLAPLKIELLHTNPGIYMVHGVLSDDEIEELKTLARPRLARAQISRGGAEAQVQQSSHRISKIAWVKHNQSVIMPRLARRVADFTGLRADDEEPLQVANYGIGGYYWPHFDYYDLTNVLEEKPNGNRIASVVFYMSEVPLGGATVFLHAGVSVFPRKGSALFWMNLHPSCEGNKATLHAACPVLMGSKWVAVLWKHQLGNELLKPCRLSR